jgi:hypothetical protein
VLTARLLPAPPPGRIHAHDHGRRNGGRK